MTAPRRAGLGLVALALLAVACARGPQSPPLVNHSYAQLGEAVMKHADLDLAVDFEARVLRGSATIEFENPNHAPRLVLDTWALRITDVVLPETKAAAVWSLGDSLPIVGRPLVIEVPSYARQVTVHYETGADARALQWLDAAQTGDRLGPFLYTQSQPILARSWVPCQDTPAVRFTYNARIHTDPGLIALMSARNGTRPRADGVYNFDMPQPIPAYLLALAVGALEFRPISERSGVYAEPSVLDAAANEFADVERMMAVAEDLYGKYRWERYDMLVLPPSFPYGGMENPRLTFLTPTLIAGDRSLVSTVAHELAHSWSGNLVTNETWSDFWLNEGFTTYFERRIVEVLYGRELVEMEALLGLQELRQEMAEKGPQNLETALFVPLAGGDDPDEELGTAAYEKGYLFLRLLEERMGRERFDDFLRGWFDRFAFKTVTSAKFCDFLKLRLLDGDPALAAELRVDEWVYRPGLPDNAPVPVSDGFARADSMVALFTAGTPAGDLDVAGWTTQQWVRFLDSLPRPLLPEQMDELEEAFAFSRANAIVRRSWFLHVAETHYAPATPALESYLARVGRRWLIGPIYERMAESEDGRRWARSIYVKSRAGYHPLTRDAVEQAIAAGAARSGA